jgi:hypothetical protein
MIRFQENAWCDEAAMDYWAKHCWKPTVKEPTLLALDLHRAQKTDHILDVMQECDITPVFVPAGLTGTIQPLDVSYNAPFKKKVEDAAAQHMHDNMDDYLNGKFTAGERRILLTNWVGDAWEEMSHVKEIAVKASRNVALLMAQKILTSIWKGWKFTKCCVWRITRVIIMTHLPT